MKPILVTPSTKYIFSYREALYEYFSESSHTSNITQALFNLQDEIKRLRDLDKPDTHSRAVKQSVLWLVFNQKYIGTIIIRHQASGRAPEIASHFYYEIRPSERGRGYGTTMLEMGIATAYRLGIEHPIVACDERNMASLSIIRTNGGLFLDRHVIKDLNGDCTMLRFIF